MQIKVTRYCFTPFRMAIMKNIRSVDKDVGKLEHLFIAGGKYAVNMQLLWENNMAIPQKIKQTSHMIQQFYFWVYALKRYKKRLKHIGMQHYSQWPKGERNPSVC